MAVTSQGSGQWFGEEPQEPVKIDVNSIADMLCDQLQLFTEEGGNDLQGGYVDEVTFGGRIVTVDFSNGQRFQIEVYEKPQDSTWDATNPRWD